MSSERKVQEPGAGCGCLAPLTAAVITAAVAWAVGVTGTVAVGGAALGAATLAALFMVIGESAIEDAVKIGLVGVVGIVLIVKGPPAVDAIGIGMLVGPVLGSLANRVVEGARRRDEAGAGPGGEPPAQSTGSAAS